MINVLKKDYVNDIGYRFYDKSFGTDFGYWLYRKLKTNLSFNVIFMITVKNNNERNNVQSFGKIEYEKFQI